MASSVVQEPVAVSVTGGATEEIAKSSDLIVVHRSSAVPIELFRLGRVSGALTRRRYQGMP